MLSAEQLKKAQEASNIILVGDDILTNDVKAEDKMSAKLAALSKKNQQAKLLRTFEGITFFW